jgi:ABC-type amino acid transport substrate-binding protein
LSDRTELAGDPRIWLVAGAAVAGLSLWAALSASAPTGDYANPRCAHWRCDDAARALHELATGHLGAAFKAQPAMGLTSIVLRAPAVAIVHAWGGGTLAEYRAGAAICMIAAAAIGIALALRAQRSGAPLSAALGFLALWAVALVWGRSIALGHPEEPLAAALAILAVVLARDRQALAAGAALGLALGTKQWTLLAAPVVLVAAPADWRRMAVPALAAVVLTIGVPAAASPTSFRDAQKATARGDDKTTTPANVWFRAGHKRVLARTATQVAYGIYPPKLVGRWTRTFVLVIALLAAALFVRRRGIGSPDVLALLALVFLLRVVLDTQTFSYHLVPMLMALPAWEALGRGRLPLAGLLAMVAFQLTVHEVAPHLSADTFNTLFLAWTLPLGAYLTATALRRRRVTSAVPA